MPGLVPGICVFTVVYHEDVEDTRKVSIVPQAE
jgi:hypothetical protein